MIILVIRRPHQLEHLVAPSQEARPHGAVMLELKLALDVAERRQCVIRGSVVDRGIPADLRKLIVDALGTVPTAGGQK